MSSHRSSHGSPLLLTLSYDTCAFPFQQWLAAQVFRVRELAQLHASWARRRGAESLAYSDNLHLRRLMQALPNDSPFYSIYHAWIAKFLAPRFGGRISYSAHPKMRVHLAGTGSVSDFHCDADVTGREDQINCYLPFTDVHDGCTVWCEREYGSQQYEPLNLKYGEALIWDGGRLRHGTFANDTTHTRVSCDFRFSPIRPERVRSPWRDVLKRRAQAEAPRPSAPLTT